MPVVFGPIYATTTCITTSQCHALFQESRWAQLFCAIHCPTASSIAHEAAMQLWSSPLVRATLAQRSLYCVPTDQFIKVHTRRWQNCLCRLPSQLGKEADVLLRRKIHAHRFIIICLTVHQGRPVLHTKTGLLLLIRCCPLIFSFQKKKKNTKKLTKVIDYCKQWHKKLYACTPQICTAYREKKIVTGSLITKRIIFQK